MRFRTCLFLYAFLLNLPPVLAQSRIAVTSPDGNIVFNLRATRGDIYYDVVYKKNPLIRNSRLGLTFENKEVFGAVKDFANIAVKEKVEAYQLPMGKFSSVSHAYKEAIIPLREREGRKRLVYFHVKVFNDGIGFRYEFPIQNNWEQYVLTEENTFFNFVGDPIARVGFLENFTSSHEHRYQVLPLSKVPEDTLIDLPAAFEFPGKIYVAVTEANLLDFAGMSLVRKEDGLRSQLTPLPGDTPVKVRAQLPHQSPWRVLMIGDRFGTLLESNLLTSLSDSCRIDDLSWLKPGKASFHWWNGDLMPDTTFEPGVNFKFNQYYIDFCASHQIDYHTVIGYRGVPWYQNDGPDYQPGPNTDILKPRTGLDMEAICQYAQSKGVGIRVWVHWKALYPKLDSAFALFQQWGIRGMMVDFMDRDDQEMVRIQERILQKAAQHHLEIQFHGVFKPTGLSRTYPNESTREGTLNYECNKWNNPITADDDMQVVFSRLLAGPTDYHLGGFRASPGNRYKWTYTRPSMLSTRCHMLAMYVVLENHLSMVCDDPTAYMNQPGFDFIQRVPTVWDETVVIGAEPGEWISMARRKGESWYLGTITNGKERQIKISLSFLKSGKYRAEIWKEDPKWQEDPNLLIYETIEVDAASELSISLPAGGGHVMILTKR